MVSTTRPDGDLGPETVSTRDGVKYIRADVAARRDKLVATREIREIAARLRTGGHIIGSGVAHMLEMEARRIEREAEGVE